MALPDEIFRKITWRADQVKNTLTGVLNDQALKEHTEAQLRQWLENTGTKAENIIRQHDSLTFILEGKEAIKDFLRPYKGNLWMDWLQMISDIGNSFTNGRFRG